MPPPITRVRLLSGILRLCRGSSLAALATATVNAAVMIPGTVSTGSYFLSAVADATGVIAEENEGNNGLTAAAQVAVVLFVP